MTLYYILTFINTVGNKIVQQLGTWRRSDEQEKCLQAFRTTCYETQKNLNPEREARTCLWCLEDERFRSWRDNSTSCLLWVTADPGCGKSVLSRALVDERLLDSAPNDTTICYFFFKDTSEEQRSPTSALAALLHQIFTSETGAKVIKYALKAFRENKEKISQNLEVMWGIIQDIALDSECGKIVFLLDALDECQSSEQKNLITKLKRLEQKQIDLGTAKNIKFFITSRPYWNIEKEFDSLISNIPGIRLRGENQSKSLRSEIDLVIRARVLRLDRQFTGPRARDLLLEGLLKVENRTYLWLYLTFDSIESEPRIDTDVAKNLLHKLPATVEAAYDAILQKSKDKLKAKKLLSIVVAAVRPLFLNEIGVALYIKEETRTLEDLEFQEIQQLQTTIRDLCGLFVSIIDEKVYLLHQTAKEFLIAQEGYNQSASSLASNRIWKHSLSIQDSNFLLAYICIWFLRLEEFYKKILPLKREEIDQLVSRYDFLEYSAMNWAVHFRAAMIPKGHSLIASGLELCNVQVDRYMSWELVYYQRAYNGPCAGLNDLHLASHLGLRIVVGLLLERGAELETKDSCGRTPLLHATVSGHNAVVELLLEKGAVLETIDMWGQTPLSYAAFEGHEVVVKLLLEKGAVLETKHNWGQKPLSHAASKGHKVIVKLLLEKGAVLETKDNWGQTPLSCAASKGHEAVVKLLLEKGAVLETKDNWGQTPLSYAASKGHEAVVKLLLEKGAVLKTKDDNGQTPLSHAASKGHEVVVKLLLEKGAQNHNDL